MLRRVLSFISVQRVYGHIECVLQPDLVLTRPPVGNGLAGGPSKVCLFDATQIAHQEPSYIMSPAAPAEAGPEVMACQSLKSDMRCACDFSCIGILRFALDDSVEAANIILARNSTNCTA